MVMNIREDEKRLYSLMVQILRAARALGLYRLQTTFETFRERGRLARALYYTALVEDQEYSPIRLWSTGLTTTVLPWLPSPPRNLRMH